MVNEPKATKEVKLKWKELGPINMHELLEKNCDIMLPIKDLTFGKPAKNYNYDIMGLIDPRAMILNGLGRANYSNMIYEGHFKNN